MQIIFAYILILIEPNVRRGMLGRHFGFHQRGHQLSPPRPSLLRPDTPQYAAEVFKTITASTELEAKNSENKQEKEFYGNFVLARTCLCARANSAMTVVYSCFSHHRLLHQQTCSTKLERNFASRSYSSSSSLSR